MAGKLSRVKHIQILYAHINCTARKHELHQPHCRRCAVVTVRNEDIPAPMRQCNDQLGKEHTRSVRHVYLASVVNKSRKLLLERLLFVCTILHSQIHQLNSSISAKVLNCQLAA